MLVRRNKALPVSDFQHHMHSNANSEKRVRARERGRLTSRRRRASQRERGGGEGGGGAEDRRGNSIPSSCSHPALKTCFVVNISTIVGCLPLPSPYLPLRSNTKKGTHAAGAVTPGTARSALWRRSAGVDVRAPARGGCTWCWIHTEQPGTSKQKSLN